MYAICYYGEDIDGADTVADAERQIREIWAAVKDGTSGYWDAEDFDGFASNPEGTGFMDAISIRKEGA